MLFALDVAGNFQIFDFKDTKWVGFFPCLLSANYFNLTF
jgi:hypothetical protein